MPAAGDPVAKTAQGLVYLLESAGRTIEHLEGELLATREQLEQALAELARRDAADVPPPTP